MQIVISSALLLRLVCHGIVLETLVVLPLAGVWLIWTWVGYLSLVRWADYIKTTSCVL